MSLLLYTLTIRHVIYIWCHNFSICNEIGEGNFTLSTSLCRKLYPLYLLHTKHSLTCGIYEVWQKSNETGNTAQYFPCFSAEYHILLPNGTLLKGITLMFEINKKSVSLLFCHTLYMSILSILIFFSPLKQAVYIYYKY